MIDTHAHLDVKEFDQDRDEVLSRFISNEGKAVITIGVDRKSNHWAVNFANTKKNVFATVSFHPEEGENISINKAIKNVSDLAGNEKAVAIGEIGLDYYWIRDRNDIEELKKHQQALFETQLGLAAELNKPVIVHCRDAYEDVYKIIANRKSQIDNLVIHCYQGDIEWTEKFLELGCWFSFTGNITFEKSEYAEIFQVIKMIPLEKMMVETDAPFLAPGPHRGKRNEPAFVKHVIEKIAEIKEISFEKVEKQTDKNAINFFNFQLN